MSFIETARALRVVALNIAPFHFDIFSFHSLNDLWSFCVWAKMIKANEKYFIKKIAMHRTQLLCNRAIVLALADFFPINFVINNVKLMFSVVKKRFINDFGWFSTFRESGSLKFVGFRRVHVNSIWWQWIAWCTYAFARVHLPIRIGVGF